MQNRFNALVLTFVSILGLYSCSKKSDDWQMSEPVIESATAEPLRLSAAARRSFNGDSLIRFSGQTWSALNVKSVCTLDGQRFESELTIPYQPTIALRALWPPSLWRTFTVQQLANSECDFEFTAKNNLGSTHGFSINHIRLTTFKSLDGVNLLSVDSFRDSDVNALAANLGDDSQLSLVCGPSSTTLTLKAALRESKIVNGFMSRSGLRGRHDCHFVAWDPSATPVKYEVSPELSMKFASVPLSIEETYPMRAADPLISRLYFIGETLVEFKISNPSLESTFLLLPKLNSVIFKLVARTASPIVSVDIRANEVFQALAIETPVDLRLDGHSIDQPGPVEIAPGQSRILSVVFQSTPTLVSCLQANPNAIVDTAGVAIGFKFGFKQDFKIQQLDKLDSTDAVDLFTALEDPPERLTHSVVFDRYKSEFGDSFNRLQFRAYEQGRGFCF